MQLLLTLLILGVDLSSQNDIYRLPKNVVPSHYNLKIAPDYTTIHFTFSGSVDINIHCLSKAGCDNITLHSRGHEIHGYSLRSNETTDEELSLNITSNNTKIDRLEFQLMEPMEFKQEYILSINFSQKNQYGIRGFFRSTYINKTTGYEHVVYATQLGVDYARAVFPCFDEPEFKATFTLKLGRSRYFSSLSNMAIKKKGSSRYFSSDALVYDQFETTPKMSTYLLAFVTSQYSSLNGKAGTSLQVKIWAPYVYLNNFTFIGENAGNFYTTYINYLQVPQPIKKVDFVVIENFEDREMENWGLITIYNQIWGIVKKYATLYGENSEDGLNYIAQGLGHFWFGNLVTPKWWSDNWLSVGMTTFMKYIAIEKVQSAAWSLYMRFVYQTAMNVDSLGHTKPLRREVKTSDDVEKMFSSMINNKGACLTRMLSYLLGEKKFRSAMTEYLTTFSYSNVEQEDLWKILSKHYKSKKINFTEVMNTWTLQPGYPVVTIKVNYQSKKMDISQTRFFKNENAKMNQSDQIWQIPLTYEVMDQKVYTSSKSFCLLKSKNKHISYIKMNKGSLLIANLQAQGYFRVNYDPITWDKIIKYLNKNHTRIYLMNRAQFIDDSFNFAESGIEEYDLPFKISKYLIQEKDTLPWLTFFRHMQEMYHTYFRFNLYKVFKNYVNMLTKDYFKDFNINLNNPSMEDNSQIFLWACFIGNSKCIEKSFTLFDSWKQAIELHNKTDVYKDYVFGMACSVFHKNDLQRSKFIFDQIKLEEDSQMAFVLREAVVCIKRDKMMETAFKSATNSFKFLILETLSRSENGRQFILEHTQYKNDTLFKTLSHYVKYIALVDSLKSSKNEREFKLIKDHLKAFLNNTKNHIEGENDYDYVLDVNFYEKPLLKNSDLEKKWKRNMKETRKILSGLKKVS